MAWPAGRPGRCCWPVSGGERETGGVDRDVRGPRSRIRRAEFLAHHAGEQPASRPDLRDLLEQVHAAVDQDGDPGSERVDWQAARQQPTAYLPDFQQAQAHLLHRVQPAVGDVVRVLEEGVEPRHLAQREDDRVEGQAHPHGERQERRIAAVLGVDRRLNRGPAHDLGIDAVRRTSQILTGQGEGRRQGMAQRHPVERETGEQLDEVLLAAQGHAGRADRRDAHRVVGIQRRYRRVVTDHVDAQCAVGQQRAELLV